VKVFDDIIKRMNEDILKSENNTPQRVVSPPPPPLIPDHPMDALHNQVDPYQKAKGLSSPKPIRTYESDVAEILAKQRSSVISIASAENDRKFGKENKVVAPPLPPEFRRPVEEMAPIEAIPRVSPRLADYVDNPDSLPKGNAQGGLQSGMPVPPSPSIKLSKPTVPPPVPPKPIAKPITPPIIDSTPAPKPFIQKPDKLAQVEAQAKLQAITEESNRKEEIISTVKKTNRLRKVFLTLVSLVFVTAGILGAIYFYLNSPIGPAPEPQVQEIKISSVIPSDSQKIVNIGILGDSGVSEKISSELKNLPVNEMAINELVPMYVIGTTTTKLTGTQFIEALGFGMPDTLKRSLTDKWMIGTYSESGNGFPFVIFTSDFFQNSFAGMLKWEREMPEELSVILDYKNKAMDPNSTSTSIFGIQGSFVDKIVKNRDIREFRNLQGETLFLYTFIDQNTIIITTSEKSIPAIVDRIDKQTYIR
jgi:hypothetical protein